MKTKAATNPTAPAMPEVVHPNAIIERHLKPVFAPYRDELIEAARKDREAEAEMIATHPDTAKKNAQKLFEAAAEGDKAAEKELSEAGGKAEYIAKHSVNFDLARAKKEFAACAVAPTWEKIAAAALPALDKALVEIQDQFNEVMAAIGEGNGVSRWDAHIGSMKQNIAGFPRRAEVLKQGADWTIRSNGLAQLVGLE